MRKAIVSGANGFVGSAVVKELISRDMKYMRWLEKIIMTRYRLVNGTHRPIFLGEYRGIGGSDSHK